MFILFQTVTHLKIISKLFCYYFPTRQDKYVGFRKQNGKPSETYIKENILHYLDTFLEKIDIML